MSREVAMESIRIAREKAGLSQSELGEIVNLDQATISRIEAGERRVFIDQLCDIADALGVPVSRLIKQAAQWPPRRRKMASLALRMNCLKQCYAQI